ncbi:conserved hypothetical protein [Ricinus communis]|uniref:Uncharacterized protein n=1 Tax=Ricinus communis TaxID=3988 RepID=B9TBI9_RICCO|nr:conserved hypothetical protein [Ricinus communis]
MSSSSQNSAAAIRRISSSVGNRIPSNSSSRGIAHLQRIVDLVTAQLRAAFGSGQGQ